MLCFVVVHGHPAPEIRMQYRSAYSGYKPEPAEFVQFGVDHVTVGFRVLTEHGILPPSIRERLKAN